MKLTGKTILTGTILLKTGLHIGGGKNSLDIGGLDSPVIKTPLNVPYIPGSSLKGKLRSLLTKYRNDKADDVHQDDLIIKKMFGYHGRKEDKNKSQEEMLPEISRLIFRDAFLDEKEFKETFQDNNAILDTQYTQEKYENTIDRKTGKAKNQGLRNIERVPAGAKFKFEVVLNIYEEDKQDNLIEIFKQAVKLLNDDYLGGSGTRGYGQVEMKILSTESRKY